MSDLKTSQETTSGAIADTDYFRGVQGGANVRFLYSAVKTWVKSWIAKPDVGLGNVDNTADVDKPVSSATQTALNLKANSSAVVLSLNGQVGALALMAPPQGRLSLQTGVPVMTTTQSAKTTLFYTPHQGNLIPLYDGTNLVPTVFTELSAATTDATKSPAAIGAGKVNDWFVWSDAGTLRLGHGPDWTDDVTRAAGTALVRARGVLVNNATIANGPAAQRGTYVGTTRSNASSQLDWIIGGSGTAGFLGVWNAYNRVDVVAACYDATASWTYSSATVRQANGSAVNQIGFVSGLAEESVSASYAQNLTLAAVSGAFGISGLALDSTTAADKRGTIQNNAAVALGGAITTPNVYQPMLGYHFVAALERGDGTNNTTFAGGSTFGLSARLRM